MAGGQPRESVGRTIIVVEQQPYLWGILRGRVQFGTAYVRSAAPAELAAVWATCRPWPWLLVGATPDVPAGMAELLAARPIAVHWLGDPHELAGRAIVHDSWASLALELERLNDLARTGLNGVRLMRNRGLQLPSGRIVSDVAHVEGMLGAGARLQLTNDDEVEQLAHRIEGEISSHDLPFSLKRGGQVLCLTPLPSYPDPHAGTGAGPDPGGRPRPG